ncbi:hypothetical protein GCM10011363_39240 [Marivita lacus]|uniref:Uncharacterized protein n=1 Tax=Marivita lacus TaxID=1323742 RepID=A0ABQ1L831_9RHOB|nr:hypothetical protein GCM10011363_39240 [Marivita lacus]
METDRGVTDEGDPWFVFCQPSGEVFIHLCRIDGLYVLDSPNVLRPLRGADFNELIADFTNQALPARTSGDDPERRVIRLERGGKVRLHPSAMLAALIWTLFLASEELVLLAPEKTEADLDSLLDLDGLVSLDGTQTLLTDVDVDGFSVGFDHTGKDASSETVFGPIDTAGHSGFRDSSQQQGLAVHNNAFALGLSTIAIAMGFMSETVLLENQRKVLEGLKELGLSKYGDDGQGSADSEMVGDPADSTMLTMLAEFIGMHDLQNKANTAASQSDAQAVELEENLAHLTADVIDETAIFKAKSPTPAIVRDNTAASEKDAPIIKTDARDDTALSFALESDSDGLKGETVSLPAFLSRNSQAPQPLMEEFKLGQTTIKASFDINEFDGFAIFELIDTTATERATSVREFDALALRLIEFLEAKDGDIGFIELENEVIMIDRTAVTGGQTEYIQWEATDGRTISFIGLAADFEQFDMIA